MLLEVITGEGKAEADKSPQMTELQVLEMLRYKTGNGDYMVVAVKESALSRKNSKDMYAELADVVNGCDPNNTFQYSVNQVKVKLNNIRSAYLKFMERISHSGEENVWRKTKQPFWWADAEALWASREATAPSVVLETGLRVKEETGTPVAEPQTDNVAVDDALPQPKAREEDAERRTAAHELRATRKAEKKSAAMKEQVAVIAEAQRTTTAELLAGFGDLFKGLTAQLERAVDMQARAVSLQEKLLSNDKNSKKRKRHSHSHSHARSSPSGEDSE